MQPTNNNKNIDDHQVELTGEIERKRMKATKYRFRKSTVEDKQENQQEATRTAEHGCERKQSF